MGNLNEKKILLVISGGIAAYKSLELIRLLRKSGAQVRCILTRGGSQFITPLSVASLSENEAYTDLWSLKDETEMGHIRLTREADMIVVAPASANLIARLANGLADDLASTTLLAADKPLHFAPAMNHMMWSNPATQRNIEFLKSAGHQIIGPDTGDMACGEHGPGRMMEPQHILNVILSDSEGSPSPKVDSSSQAPQNGKLTLKGKRALITAGPTHEPIDPVRFIGNHSSGKQGFAIAEALACAGADVTLICGPTPVLSSRAPDRSPGQAEPRDLLSIVEVQTAEEMLTACQTALPADIFIAAAAVADWAAEPEKQKIKKGKAPPSLKLKENPDILHTIATGDNRPHLVIGFAAETENLLENARAKRLRKECDWLLANDVSDGAPFGSDENHVYLVTGQAEDDWGRQPKTAIAEQLTQKIEGYFNHDRLSQAAE